MKRLHIIKMSLLQVDDVVVGKYVDMSNRYYKVVKVTPMKVKVYRLKTRFDETGKDLGPGKTTYGELFTMTKVGETEVTHYGMVCKKM